MYQLGSSNEMASLSHLDGPVPVLTEFEICGMIQLEHVVLSGSKTMTR